MKHIDNFWFTDYRFLNDPSELSHDMDTARDMLLDAQTGLDGRACWFPNAPPICSARNARVFRRKLRQAHDDLGQWRAYAGNGREFAVGFAPHMFRIKDDAELIS